MTQEELKTCLGQLLLDLRGNWAYDYSSRLRSAKDLCIQINDDTSDIENAIESELEGDYDGRVFRDCNLYGYRSQVGNTEATRSWLNDNLSNPDLCDLLD